MAKRGQTAAEKPQAEDWDGTDESQDAARREALTGNGGTGSGILSAGPALTEAQLDGLDPIDAEEHLDQAARRSEMTNMQTDHELQNGLDPVSGRAPMPNPLNAVSRETLNEARSAFERAERQDIANGKKGNEASTYNSAGWRSLRDLGIAKATADALVAYGRVEVGSAPGMSHMPETGRLYRIKRDDR